MLKRLGIRWKHARWHIHSPDPHYHAKLGEIAASAPSPQPILAQASSCISRNPIEKLWRKLREERLHLHPLACDLTKLREVVYVALTSFAHGSAEFLRYVGLRHLRLNLLLSIWDRLSAIFCNSAIAGNVHPHPH